MAQSRREFLKSAGAVGAVGAVAVAGGSADVGGARVQTGADQDVRTIQNQDVRTIRTEVLDIAYEESGNSAGFPIILLHGFPYDVRSWDGVVPPLADAGQRVQFKVCELPVGADSCVYDRGIEKVSLKLS